MNADKRTVSTDALETLGTIIGDSEARDAIHLAVEPVTAGQHLVPGEDVGFLAPGVAGRCDKPLGIVDPFLKDPVLKGERFWLVVYPRQITSLRHVWTHPAFSAAEVEAPATNDPVSASKKWIEDFAASIDQTYNRLMSAADEWVSHGEYTYDNSESYKGHWEKFPEFWNHYEVVTGKTVKEDDRGSFFTCSC